MLLLGAGALLSAIASGWALSSLFTTANTGLAARAFLSGGALPLLHAQEEREKAAQKLAGAKNAEIAVLTSTVDGLKSQLTALDTQVHESQKMLNDLEKNSGDEELRKKSVLEEKSRLEKLWAAFVDADKERRTADTAKQAAMATSMPSVPSLDQLKSEWPDVTEATEQIAAAKKSFTDLNAKKTEWETGKDTFSPDEQKTMQSELRSMHDDTSKKLKAAREAVAKVEKPLNEKIAAQKSLLEKAKSDMKKP